MKSFQFAVHAEPLKAQFLAALNGESELQGFQFLPPILGKAGLLLALPTDPLSQRGIVGVLIGHAAVAVLGMEGLELLVEGLPFSFFGLSEVFLEGKAQTVEP